MPQGYGHIFDGHLLPRLHDAALPAPAAGPAWMAWLLVFCLALLVVVRSVAYPRLVRIVRSTFSGQILQQLEREEVNLFRLYAVALNLLFILNVAFLGYKFNAMYGFVVTDIPGFLQFLFVLGAVLAIALLRLVMNRLLAVVTGARKLISEYLVSSTLVNQTLGLVLFPCLVLVQFSDISPVVFMWVGVAALGASLLLRWYRGLVMAAGAERLGIIEIFSYFCTLEILPVLVLVKYLVENY